MKKCSDCQVELSLEMFHRRGASYQSVCKPCRKVRDAGRVYNQDKKRVWQRSRRAWLAEYKRDKPCVDCGGVFHPAAMQFDHIFGTSKTDDVSSLIIRVSLKCVLEEIAKCELVCANCHAVRTYNRGVA